MHESFLFFDFSIPSKPNAYTNPTSGFPGLLTPHLGIIPGGYGQGSRGGSSMTQQSLSSMTQQYAALQAQVAHAGVAAHAQAAHATGSPSAGGVYYHPLSYKSHNPYILQ
jgi:hypothetical protein